jgi:hypothetical protein
MNKSWRTTTLGIIAIVTAVAGFARAILDGDATTEPDAAALVAAIVAGVGLMFAKDAKVSGLPGDAKGGA